MKKLILIVFLAAGAMNMHEASANNAAQATSYEVKTPVSQAEVNDLTTRLQEINVLAKGELSTSEKHSLRKEVLSIKQRLSGPLGGGFTSLRGH